jgi:hypothetical protein
MPKRQDDTDDDDIFDDRGLLKDSTRLAFL